MDIGALQALAERQAWEELTTNLARWMDKSLSARLAAQVIKQDYLEDTGMRYMGQPAHEVFKPGGSIDASLLSIDRAVARRWTTMIGTYMLLSGLSIEGLAKGLILTRNPERITSGVLKWGTDGHNLCELVRETGFSIENSEQVDLLRRLSESIRWQGRYPAPRKHDAKPGRTGMNIPGDFTLIDSIQDTLIAASLALLSSEEAVLIRAQWLT